MKRKQYRIFTVFLLCIALLTVSAGAYMGSEPHIGIHVYIANGTRENILQRVLQGDKDTPYTEFV